MKHATTPASPCGFSLVELSIVLVILGLLTGGILGGRELIRAAELRKAAKDAEIYMTAVYTFKSKYLHLPGDMPNATRFWGAHATLCAGEPGPTSATGTCNGNGNGRIQVTGDFGEHTFFWNHLSQSGIVPGAYEMDWNDGVKTGIHAPKSAFSNASYMAEYIAPQSATSQWWFEGLQGHMFRFGVPNNGICNSCFNAIPGFLPEEAWLVDSKVDDGKPGTGNVQAAHGAYGTATLGCADTNDSSKAASAEYAISGTYESCLQVYRFY